MKKILEAYGIPPKIVDAICDGYSNTRAKVTSPDGETEEFIIQAGVLQGDTLAPYLFIIVLDYALRKAIDGKEETFGFTVNGRRSRRVGPTIITDLDFADDIALISNEIEQAQQLLLNVERECKKVGLRLNTKKTKYMAYNTQQSNGIKTDDGTELDMVPDFKYLGAWMESSEKDIKVRIALAWKALNSMNTVWSSCMSQLLKVRLFTATVESVLLYGCEAWTLNKRLEKWIDGCYTRMLRAVKGVHWSMHMHNSTLYGTLRPVSEKIRSRRLRLAGTA